MLYEIKLNFRAKQGSGLVRGFTPLGKYIIIEAYALINFTEDFIKKKNIYESQFCIRGSISSFETDLSLPGGW